MVTLVCSSITALFVNSEFSISHCSVTIYSDIWFYMQALSCYMTIVGAKQIEEIDNMVIFYYCIG